MEGEGVVEKLQGPGIDSEEEDAVVQAMAIVCRK